MEESAEFMELLDKVVEDGELSYQEIYQIAKWINEHKEARQNWPVKDFTKLLQDAFADGKIDKREANEVGLLIQRVRREWSRKNTLEIAPAGESFFSTAFQSLKRKASEVGQAIQRARQEVPAEKAVEITPTLESVVATAIEKFDIGLALLPTIPVHFRIQSESEPDTEYLVDLTVHSCSCPDFKSKRKDLPHGHLSRCCKHVFQAFDKVAPKEGWPGWLDSFFELGIRPYPQQEWIVIPTGDNHALISSPTNDWANVYLKSETKNLRYGYNVNEDRWSYGNEPPNSRALEKAIYRLRSR